MERRTRGAPVLAGLLGGLLLALGPLGAAGVEPVNRDRDGLAIHGYDPVAYFTEGRARSGSPEHELRWQGAMWRFASAENRDAFRAEPERYAPQYGGYCAKAVSEGDVADVDPEAWRIVDGRLFLNYSPRVQRLWERDIPGRIARADGNWPRLLAGER